MDSCKGVLFVSHEATRTGAPIALLHFLRWFKKNSNRPFSILVPSGGELVAEFRDIAQTWLADQGRWRRGGVPARVLAGAGMRRLARRAERAEMRRFASRCSPALVYVNSIASAPLVETLAPEVAVVTHVHELEYSFYAAAGSALSNLLAKSNRFIACSQAVQKSLETVQGVAARRIETVHESIPVETVRAEWTKEQVFAKLGISEGMSLVAGGGAHAWRKGADVFVLLAQTVIREKPNTYFAWIGGVSDDIERIRYDIQRANLAGRMFVTGPVKNAADYLAAADMFVLTSREDPYPLICLEAAALGKPVVCFAGAGGMPEFVERDCGFVVPYLDVRVLAERVISLVNSPELRCRMGTAAEQKVTCRHDISVAAPRVMEIIERTIAGG